MENGNCVVVKELEHNIGFGSTEFFVFRPYSRLTSSYLHYFLRNKLFTQNAEPFMKGSAGQKRVTSLYMYTHPFWLPPLPEQKAIAAYLDEKTAQIDQKIALLKKKVERYAELKEALINETVTRGLDATVGMKESGIEWIGEIPVHWKTMRNKELFKERSIRSSTGKETLLTVSHLTGVTLRSEKTVNMFMAKTMEGYKLCKKGDLLVNTMWAWMGALGTSNYKGICSPSYTVYMPRKGVPYNQRYFDYLYRTPNSIVEMTRNSKGIVSSRLRLYTKEFFQIMIVLPDEATQKSIANYLDEKTSKIEQIIEKINRQIEKLAELRKILINDVVTGQIKVV